MAAIEKRTGRGVATRTPTGLLLSIGDKTISRGGREIPTRIDHFRPKEGQLEQYAAAVAKFHDVYGAEPKQLDDVYFLSNEVGAVLEIRLMAWGSSGLRLAGDTNYALLPMDEWEEAAYAFDDDVTFYPLNASEVPKALQASWKGAPVRDKLKGPDDARIKKYEINIEATLTFLLPKVMGVGTVAKITTKSKRSMRNLYSSVWDQFEFFQGHLAGPPFRLSVRPARTRRFDEEKRAMVPVDFFELVLDSTLTVDEIYEHVTKRKEALAGGRVAIGSPEARAFTKALALPVASEDPQLREEPEAEGDHPDDASLNRIARLEELVGADAAGVTLRGVFGVESATELDQEAAVQYERILVRSLPAAEDVVDVEVLDNDGAPIEFGEPS